MLDLACSILAAGLHAGPASTQVQAALSVDPAHATLAAEVCIEYPKSVVGDVEFLIGRGFRIRHAAATCANVTTVVSDSPWPDLRRIRVHRTCDSPLTIHLAYSGALSGLGDSPINVISPALVELSLDSMWLPLDARLVPWPSIDLQVSGLPDDSRVVSGPTAMLEQGRWRLHFAGGQLDAAFMAAPGSRPLTDGRVVLESTRASDAVAPSYAGQIHAITPWIRQWFGDFPEADPIKVALVHRASASGYSRPGYIVVSDARPGGEAGIARFMAHELAHAWFHHADPAGPDRWIDEGFAEYVALRWLEAWSGEESADIAFAIKSVHARHVGAVTGRPRDDDALYEKTPVLLRDLEHRIGRARMDDFVRAVALGSTRDRQGVMLTLKNVAGQAAARDFDAALQGMPSSRTGT